MPDFRFHLINGNDVVETATEPLGNLDEATVFARRIVDGLRTEGWVDEKDVQLVVLDEKGLELFRFCVV